MTVRRGPVRAAFSGDAAGGIVLIAATALAMIAANLPATAHGYAAFLHWRTGPVLSPALGPMTVHLWINDALMAVFFLLVGLEIKREFLEGDLSRPDQRRLPFVAAGAGMAMPALVYLAIAGTSPGLARGWAIPAATDIAFAIGMLALLGRHVPASLKILLSAIAVVDDMGAVAIIAIGYTESIDWAAIAAAAGLVAIMYAIRGRTRDRLWPFLIAAVLLWFLILISGVHATIAGVVAALLIPIAPASGGASGSPLHRLEHALKPWVTFAIVPLFAFANAGIALTGLSPAILLHPLVIGIALGLFVGKQLGVFGGIWIAERIGVALRPGGASWTQIYGLSLVAGIGFTMSLFIGGLAFPGDAALVDAVKIGVLAGSILAAVSGVVVLRLASREP